MIRAILYDLDGVLVDAVDIHKRAFNAALTTVTGKPLTDEEHLKDFNGLPTKKKLEMLIARRKITPVMVPFIERLKQEMTIAQINELLKTDHHKTRLHRWAKMSGIKIGCVTNSIRETAELMLKNTGQLKYMKLVITNQDVDEPKPSPEGYFKAMAMLGVKPENTLIVEDSEKGVSAAKKTGAHLLVARSCKEVNIDSIKDKIIESSFSSVWSAALS